ncbi:hypothetical protein M1563_03345, partial [Patescibacteria group bacterium]|nr:hypothetical protein [Patescibacteria group bacterium]
AQHQQYEQASQVKKILEGLNYLTQSSSIEGYLEEPNYLQNQNKLALQTLQEALKLPNLPERIECFDISNTGGQQAVGSLVVLTHGEIDKKWYRKFKIRLPNKPNDVGMMKEVIGRRLQHPEWPKPDLMIVDGGKGQLSGAWQVLSNSQWQVPIFGLAKRREWVIPLNGSTIKISHHSPALKLLQKIRDEAHRVAISFHRKLRAQAFVNSK